jgi:chromosome segregation ATPase
LGLFDSLRHLSLLNVTKAEWQSQSRRESLDELARILGIFAGTIVLTVLSGMGIIAYGQRKTLDRVSGKVDAAVAQVKGEVSAAAAPAEAKAQQALEASNSAYNAWKNASDTFSPILVMLQDELKASREDRKELAEKYAEAQAESRDKELRINTYQSTIDKLMDDYNKLKRDFDGRAEEHQRRDARLAGLEGQVKAVSDDLETTRRELEQARGDLTKTQAELEATKVDLAKAQARISEITRDRDAQRSLAAEQKRKLEAELAQEHVKVEELQKLVGEQQARITFLESEVARLTTELATRPVPNETVGPAKPEGS